MRYVCPLTEQQRELLESTMKNDASHRARMRAHGLLLSSEGITIKAIAKIYHVDRDTVAIVCPNQRLAVAPFLELKKSKRSFRTREALYF